MSETFKAVIGGIHRLQMPGERNITEGEIVKQIRDRYLCRTSENMFYHISETGEVIFYVDESNGLSADYIKPSSKFKKDICVITINLLNPVVFLFEKEPIESLKHYLVFDMYRTDNDAKMMLTKNGNYAQVYEVGIDDELDKLWRIARTAMKKK